MRPRSSPTTRLASCAISCSLERPLRSPRPGVRHRRPWLGRRQGAALLDQLDRDRVGRSDEGHMTVARRAVDRHPCRLQLGAGCVDVVDAIGEMAEIAAAAIGLRVPVVGEFDKRRLVAPRLVSVAGRGEKDQRVAAFFIFQPPGLDKAEQLEKRNRRLEIGHADHRMQVFHRLASLLRMSGESITASFEGGSP